MKIRPFAFTVLSGLVIALGLAVLVSQSASAQCFNPLGLPVTCPGSNTGDKKKKPVLTPVTALGAPRPTPTQPSQASPGSTAACVPSQDQLASLCAALPGAGGSNGGSNPTNPGGDTPTAPKPQMFSFFQLELGGAGGVLLGILIGLLLPAVGGLLLPAVRGLLLPAVKGGISGNGFTDGTSNKGMGDGSVRTFDKDAKFDKDDGFLKWETTNNQGNAGNQFIKGNDAFAKGADGNISSDIVNEK